MKREKHEAIETVGSYAGSCAKRHSTGNSGGSMTKMTCPTCKREAIYISNYLGSFPRRTAIWCNGEKFIRVKHDQTIQQVLAA